MTRLFSEPTPEMERYISALINNNKIEGSLYDLHHVNQGLRDAKGKGVLTGLTEISEIVAKVVEDGLEKEIPGQLYYRGINIEDLTKGFVREKRFGFEETTYLLIFGKLPSAKELENFCYILSQYRELPTGFVRDIIMKAPSRDMMNTLARSVLTLFSYDDYASNTSIDNVLRQSLELIALFPLLAVYGYQTYCHYSNDQSLYIHRPKPEYSTAENILHILRPDSQFTELEARILDIALVLHAEHGGGNNSTFTCHVVTSSGTDTYSAIAAALGSLRGPRHGGANLRVVGMFEDIKTHVKDWTNEEEIEAYLEKILDKEAYDHSGLVYGMGHAVYSISDPRASILKEFVADLAKEKNRMEEFALYDAIERLAPAVITKKRKMFKTVSPNVDFYSGFVYEMLNLPKELLTPIFAIARIAGWSAHRMEEIINSGKIIRPAYMNVQPRDVYVPLHERKDMTSNAKKK